MSAEPAYTGVLLPARNDSRSTSAPTASSRSQPSIARFQALPADGGGLFEAHQLLGRHGGATGRAGEPAEHVAPTVDHAEEVLAVAHGPRRRGGAEADLRLDLVEQLQRIAARAVELVQEGEHGQVAAAAHLEQLQRLRLDALGGVEHHHDGVDGGEHAVGVLAEVLWPGVSSRLNM